MTGLSITTYKPLTGTLHILLDCNLVMPTPLCETAI